MKKKIKKEILKEKIEKGEVLNIDDIINENNENKEFISYKLVYETIYNNKILEDFEEYILYDNKIYKKKQTKYYKDKNKNIEIYKCKNARKNQRV